MRLKMNMKVVIANMNILDGDDNKPGLPLGKSVRPNVVHRSMVESYRRMWTETAYNVTKIPVMRHRTNMRIEYQQKGWLPTPRDADK
jgi:hypothetical protein